jgi:hypothetical protein
MTMRNAITSDYAKKLLRDNGFTPNPERYISPMFIEEDERQAWVDINSAAVRRGDEMPEHPIRIFFTKVQQAMCVDYVPGEVRELTAEEAKNSKAMGREPWEQKTSPWPPKESGK